MLLAFVVLIIVLLHIQFFVRNILFGTDEVNFFTFTIRYLFDRNVVLDSLYFASGCIVALALGYLIAHRLGRPRLRASSATLTVERYALPLWPLVAAGLLQVVVSLNLAIQSGFTYQLIAESQSEAGFIFELRMIFLLLLSHLMLNVRLAEILADRRFRTARVITYLYIFTALLMQARSRVFEVGAVLAFTQLMWHGDRLRFKYFVALAGAMIVPNIIVLGRLGWPEDIKALLDGIFSFEYTVLFNNLLSAAIDAGPNMGGPFTFTPSMGLLLPSPIRALFGIDIVKSDYYTELSETANLRNGGFALLAELYTNFGWYALVVLAFIGMLIGYLNARAMRVGRVSIAISAAPLLYTAFILAFRNDLGVFMKYAIQLLVITLIMQFLISAKVSHRKRKDA